jgi:hypothetical protein
VARDDEGGAMKRRLGANVVMIREIESVQVYP